MVLRVLLWRGICLFLQNIIKKKREGERKEDVRRREGGERYSVEREEDIWRVRAKKKATIPGNNCRHYQTEGEGRERWRKREIEKDKGEKMAIPSKYTTEPNIFTKHKGLI